MSDQWVMCERYIIVYAIYGKYYIIREPLAKVILINIPETRCDIKITSYNTLARGRERQDSVILNDDGSALFASGNFDAVKADYYYFAVPI